MRVLGRAAIVVAAYFLAAACQGTIVDDEAQEVRTPPRGGSAIVCDGKYLFQSVSPGVKSCCQDGNHIWQTINGRRLAHRVIGTSCTEADGVGTNCGVGTNNDCEYGPCGTTAPDIVIDAASVKIFHPDSMPEKCGWEVEDVVACRGWCDWWTDKRDDRSYPEPYDGQEEYAGQTSQCPYTTCAAGGIPIILPE